MVARRAALIAAAFVAAIGVALARGRKAEEAPPAPEPAAEAAPAAEPLAAAPPAPRLFPNGLPADLGPLPPGLASPSAQTCGGCHYAAHETWAGSRHAVAWSSPSYQLALRAAGDSPACLGCHLPLLPQHDTLANGYVDGDLTRPRLEPNNAFSATLRAEGVSCAACHVREGQVLGTRPSESSPHPVVVSEELQSAELCATCHQLTWPGGDRPFYDTWGEWKGSAWASAGVDCLDCHMAPTAGTPTPGSDGSLPSHAMGSRLQRALTVLVDLPSTRLQRGQPVELKLTVQNTGAGHAFPTGNPFKAGAVELRFLDSAGKEVAPAWTVSFARQVDLAPPFKTLEDTRLSAGGQWAGSHSFTPSLKSPAGMGVIVATVVSGSSRSEALRLPVDWR